jgi:hypothetical protein
MFLFRILCLALLLCGFTSAQEVVPEQPTVEPEKAVESLPASSGANQENNRDFSGVLTFEKPFHDFGTVEQVDRLETSFQFVNTGYEVIEVEKVEADCGCTVPQLDKMVYEPGDSGILIVQFDPSQFVGEVEKKIWIRFTNAPEMILKVKANVIAEIAWSPRRISLASIALDATTQQAIEVSSDTLSKLEITQIKTYPDWLKAEIAEQSEKRGKLQLTIDPASFPKGQTKLRGYLSFATNANIQRNIRIPVEVSTRQQFTAEPPSAMFWNVNVNSLEPAEITIVSDSEAPFEIRDWRAKHPFVAVEIADNRLKVSLKAEAPAGRFADTIALTLVQGEQDFFLNIPVRGKILGN